MIKKIEMGKTTLDELHQVFSITKETLENEKARLFPIGNTEQERPTVSIFLASLVAVKEYREELFLTLGVNKIRTRNVGINIYTEIDDGNKNNRPDALVVITSGKTTPIIEWACFIEAKIGDNILEDNQIDRYCDYAKEKGINEIITISNMLVTSPLNSPIKSKKRNFKFYHWSWAYLKVMASRLVNIDAIEDPDHKFILLELRKYFDEHKNLKNFINMGSEWKNSVMAVQSMDKTQKINSNILENLIISLMQEEKDISLQLTDKTPYLVELYAKNERINKIEEMLQNEKVLTSEYIINGNRQDNFYVEIDFTRQEIRCFTKFVIKKGKAQAQTTTLLKMLENNAGYTEKIFINAIYTRNKSIEKDTISLSSLLDEKSNGSTYYSILDKSYGDTVKYFEIKTKDLLGKRFQGNRTFIDDLEKIVERFIEQIMTNLINK